VLRCLLQVARRRHRSLSSMSLLASSRDVEA
jgi:hypothetical protein